MLADSVLKKNHLIKQILFPCSILYNSMHFALTSFDKNLKFEKNHFRRFQLIKYFNEVFASSRASVFLM